MFDERVEDAVVAARMRFQFADDDCVAVCKNEEEEEEEEEEESVDDAVR